MPMHAQLTPTPADPAPAEEEPIKMMEFFVQERGVSRATNSITTQDTKVALPGVTVEKLLSLVPGVNVVTRDPFGFYESGNDIRVRSFGISALALTIDDVPMGNNSTRYGTPAGRIVDAENISTINVSQGTGDVTTPAYESLGGAIKYYTANPSREMGATLKHSVGDFDLQRSFFKVETGEIIPGLTSYVSASQLTFKSAGLPKDSEGRKLEAKIRYELPKVTATFAFTWNDRDDYDTQTVQWDRWRALETGDALAGYGTASIYSSSALNDLKLLAAGGYTTYYPYAMPAIAAKAGLSSTAALSVTQQGDYSDYARSFGPSTYIDPTLNHGDGINSRYYKYWRNGRMDAFYRGVFDVTVTDEITGKIVSYYHDRKNYGTFPVSRADARTQVVNAYNATNNPNRILRPDIYPRYAYRDAVGNLVPIGTAGAVPVGYNDANANGFFDVGETLNAGTTVTEFSSAHALIAPTSTTLANATSGIPGATGRDEDIQGYRWGIDPTFTWVKGANTLKAGFWYEVDGYSAYRPTYNLEGGSVEGTFLYDQVLFNNYTQSFRTITTQLFIEEGLKLFDDRLTLTAGAKALNVEKKAQGILYTQAWWKPLGQQYVSRKVTYKDRFLPQIGASYTLRPGIELFAGVAENLAAPNSGIIANVDFDTTLQPERATNYETGVRYAGKTFGATFAVFYNKYEQRILSQTLTQEELVARGLSGVTGATTFRNVGGIDSSGAELSYDWRTPVKGLRVSGAVAYQRSVFAENLLVPYSSFHSSTTDPRAKFYVPIVNADGTITRSWELQKDKDQGNTPEFTANIDANYSWKFLDFNFGGRFFDSVYVNTLNTEEVPSYVVFKGGITASGPKGTRLAPFKASLTVENIFDEVYWTARGYNAAFNGSVGSGDYGRNIVFTVEAKF